MVSAPTIDDARTAGRALTGAGSREVLEFGSVARGDADPHSDIDLVVILDDLEYRRRRDAAEASRSSPSARPGSAWTCGSPTHPNGLHRTGEPRRSPPPSKATW